MKPDEKVVSLETARKLKAAGFPQETEKYWVTDSESGDSILHPGTVRPTVQNVYAAPDAQEIGELLPPYITEDGYENPLLLAWFKSDSMHSIQLLHTDVEGRTERVHWFDAVNEAEARAACWLYLKSKGMI